MPAACIWIWTSSATGSPTSISSMRNPELSSQRSAPLVFTRAILATKSERVTKQRAILGLNCVNSRLHGLVRYANRQPAVDDELAAGGVRRLVRGQVDDAGRHLAGIGAATHRDLQEVLGDAGCHLSPNQPGADRVPPDGVWRHLQRRGLGQAAHPEFRGDVAVEPRAAAQALDRRDIDDRTTAGRGHRLDGGLHAQKRPGEVDVDDLLPVGQREVLQGIAVEDAGVVHQYVERAEFAQRHSGSCLPLIWLRHVEVDEPHGVTQFLCQRVAFVIEDVAGDDPGAFGDQRPRMRGAHTACAAADQCNFSVYASHGGSGYRYLKCRVIARAFQAASPLAEALPPSSALPPTSVWVRVSTPPASPSGDGLRSAPPVTTPVLGSAVCR